jgi:homospermidine synthase
MEFNKKVLMIGYGSVARCTLPLLLKHIKIPYQNLTIIDFEDKAKALKPWTEKGIKYFQERITRQNLNEVLLKHLEKGGLLVDLAWNIDCCAILKWCHDNEVLYVNTSVEEWDPKKAIFKESPYEKSLYFLQMKLRNLIKDWKDGSITAVIDHGANPGLISHFTKQGLVDIAEKLIADKKAKDPEKLSQLIKDGNFAELAMNLEIKSIHCSERDT